MRRPKYVVGIDEVGRGPLAGPLVVGAVLMPAGVRLQRKGLKDSKKLSPKSREEWATYIASDSHLAWALAEVSPKTVDRLNVARAANLAALRAFSRLAKVYCLHAGNCAVYLDGGLYLGNGRVRLPGKTVVKGDEKIPAVALASIMAKVRRDRIMTAWSRRYPGYSFEVHKGYGTAVHWAALQKLGPSAAHRLTFLRKWNTINTIQSYGRRTHKTS